MPKISELNELSSLYANDYFAVAHDLNGLPSTKKINVNNLANAIFLTSPNKILPSIPGNQNQFLLANSTGGSYWSDNPGLDSVVIINYTDTYNATVDDNYIFCDPNDVGPVITIILPSNGPEGKEYNIKNLTGVLGVNYITVTTDAPTHRYLENPETGQFVSSYNIYNRGDMQTWIHDGLNYRHIGSQTGTPVFITSANTYQQVVIKNINSGNNASADLVLYSDTADYTLGTGPFIDIGIESSTYANNEFSLFGFNDAYVYTGNANLLIGTSTQNTFIKFFTANTHADNLKLTITDNQIVSNVDIIPSQNSVFSLGTPNNQWKHLYVSNTTIYINNIPLSINDDGRLLVNNSDIVQSAVTEITPIILQQLTNIQSTGAISLDNLTFFSASSNTSSNTGYTGSVGFTGSKGFDGTIGYTGSAGGGSGGGTGYTGSVGFTGPRGFDGTIGYTGSRGFNGSNGLNGYTGSKGASGEAAAIGYTGCAGASGFNGSVGFSGSKGFDGTSGYNGSRGYAGSASTAAGFTGSIGFTGSLGFLGSKGFTGSASTAPGFTGSTGIAGQIGFTGSHGFVGSASTAPGYTGSIGIGFTGSSGFVGSASTAPGFSGSIGFTGSKGFNGSTGFVGSASTAPGFTGSIGFSGSRGFSGSVGFNGSTSTEPGFTGSIGFTGSKGFEGSASTVPGFTGSTGIGFTGSAGFWGSRGYNGSVGFAGSAGAGSLPSRVSKTVTTDLIAAGTSTNIDINGFKGYDIYSIQVDNAAWVTVYTSIAARISDSARSISTNPTSGIGVVAEMISTGPVIQLITPAVRGFSSENPPTNSIPLKVYNNGSATSNITVTLTLIQTEL